MVLQDLENKDIAQVNIVRTNLVQDVLDFHTEKENLAQGVQFQFVGEPGVDLDGIKRDVFTLFWRQARCRFLEGNDNSFIPRVTGLSREQYVLLGRIISYGYVTAGIFPAFLNKGFMQALLCGEDSLADHHLIDALLDYLTVYERERLLRLMGATHLSLEDIDFLVDFADRGGVALVPTVHNIRNIVVEVSRAILVNAPMHCMAKLKEGMLQVKDSSHVWCGIKPRELHRLYSELLPTPEKITSILSANCVNREEERVFSFLKQYTRSLNQDNAVAFLRWITGSETLTVSSIKVEFHKSNEVEPYPRVHVCGSVLDISSRGYSTYQKFQQIMNSVICSEEAFKFASV